MYHGIICKIYQNMQINSDNQMLPKMVWHPNIRSAKFGSWWLKTRMKILQTIEFHRFILVWNIKLLMISMVRITGIPG